MMCDIRDFKISSYLEAPMKVVSSFKVGAHTFQTYGVLLYAIDTKRWFLVQRRHSVGVIHIVKGNFKISDIPNLISDMTLEEMELLGRVTTVDDFTKLKNDILQYKDDRYIEYIWEKIEISLPIIKLSIDKYKENPNSLTWLWPKGFKRSSIYKEEGIEAAFREFTEESGINLDSIPHNVNYRCLTNKSVGLTGHIHITKCWVGYILNEIALTSVDVREVEVSNRSWMDHNKILDVLPDDHVDLYLKATKLVNTMIEAIPE